MTDERAASEGPPTDGSTTDGADPASADEMRVDNGARTLTLGELASTQPGMGRLMPEVGSRTWKLYHAAKAGNWPMARYQLEEAVALLKLSAFVRPKYDQAMSRFLAAQVEPLGQAIEAGDWPTFSAAFDAMVRSANGYHGQFGKGFIQWKVPEMPPPDLDLTPLA